MQRNAEKDVGRSGSDAVRETAVFGPKRLDRLANRGDYKRDAIL